MHLVHTPRRRTSLVIAGLAALTLVAAACGDDTKDAVSTDNTPATTANGSSPSSLDGMTYLSTGSTGFDIVADSTISISFQDGSLSANAGCNTMNSSYSVADGVLTAGPMAMTQMACDEALMTQDATISTLLSGKPKISVDGDTLTITDGTKTLTMQDRKVADPDRPLSGTAWTVSSAITNEAATSWTDVTATITFDVKDDGTGTAQVNAGCNTGSATVTVTDTDITWGPLALTKKMCDENAMQMEGYVVTTLTGTSTYTIEAGKLTLMNGTTGLELTAGS